jgi:hypothetical protein
MSLDDLTPDEREIVRRCLVAAAQGPYFPDWEFPMVFGVARAEVAEILRRWPYVDDSKVVDAAINNAFVNLLWYPHEMTDQLEDELGVTTARLEQVFTKWRKS